MDEIDKSLLKGYAERYREACKEFDKAKEKYIYSEVKVEEADELRESSIKKERTGRADCGYCHKGAVKR